MSLYIIIHNLKTSLEEFSSVMESEGPMELAKAMATGQTPAKCLKSWNPLPYGKNICSFVCGKRITHLI